MEAVVLTILILGSLSFVLKLGFKSPWRWLGWAVAMGVAAGMAWPLAAGQSKTQIADFLQSPAMMADAAVLITMEVALMGLWCFLRASDSGRQTAGRRLTVRLLDLFPGVLVFIALFSLLTTLIFTLTGKEFAVVSWGMGAALLVLVPVLTWALRKLLPEEALRLELIFVVELIIGGLGVVATVNGRTAVEGTAAAEWPQLATVGAMCLAGAATGWILYKRHRKRKQQ